jgi:hypothetical protein
MKKASDSGMIMVFWDVKLCNSVSAELQGIKIHDSLA